MNALLIIMGAGLAALALAMAANRAGLVFFIVGPRAVLFLAAIVATSALWAAHAPNRAHVMAGRATSHGAFVSAFTDAIHKPK